MLARIYERAFFGPAGSKDILSIQDLTQSERTGAGVAVALILLIGLAPMLAVPMISGSTDALMATLGAGTVDLQTTLSMLWTK